jgi:hypothetical protein
MAGPAQGLGGRALQLGRDRLVGTVGGLGPVPGPPGRLVVAERPGQGPVGGLAGGRAGPVVDRRADQRVPERQRRPVDPDQAGQPARLQAAGVQAQPPGRAADGGQPAALGRGQQQQGLGVGVVAADPVQEGLLQHPGHGQGLLERVGPRALAWGEGGRQLQQGQRVAAAGLEQPAPDGRGQPAQPAFPQEGGGRLGVQPGQVQRRHPLGALGARLPVAEGDQQRHRLGLQPAGDEAEHGQRGRVGRVGVVDQAQQRPVLGRLRQQGEGGHGHQEPVGRRAGLQPDRDP